MALRISRFAPSVLFATACVTAHGQETVPEIVDYFVSELSAAGEPAE